MNTKEHVSQAVEEPFHYRYRNFFVGLFILVPALIVPALIVYSLVKSDMLEKWRELYVSYESGEGLQNGSSVNVRGIKVGHVKSVSLNERGEVDVLFRIKSRYAKFVKKNSVARLKQSNFVVGDWEIDLVGGGQYSPSAEEGDTLKGEVPVQLGQTVQQVTNMVASFETILQSILAGEGLLGRLLESDTLEEMASGLLQRVERMFGQVDRLVLGAHEMVAKLGAFGEHGTATVDTLMTFSHHADSLVAMLHVVADDLDGLVGTLGGMPADVDTVLQGLKKDVDEAEVLLRGLQNHWLFRRSVRKAREKEQRE
jgi:phospholipid/cholesterol/gamma-HCH transport system substrate-binding protein